MGWHNNNLEENKNLTSYAKINSRHIKDLNKKFLNLPRISKRHIYCKSQEDLSQPRVKTQEDDLSVHIKIKNSEMEKYNINKVNRKI